MVERHQANDVVGGSLDFLHCCHRRKHLQGLINYNNCDSFISINCFYCIQHSDLTGRLRKQCSDAWKMSFDIRKHHALVRGNFGVRKGVDALATFFVCDFLAINRLCSGAS